MCAFHLKSWQYLLYCTENGGWFSTAGVIRPIRIWGTHIRLYVLYSTQSHTHTTQVYTTVILCFPIQQISDSSIRQVAFHCPLLVSVSLCGCQQVSSSCGLKSPVTFVNTYVRISIVGYRYWCEVLDTGLYSPQLTGFVTMQCQVSTVLSIPTSQ